MEAEDIADFRFLIAGFVFFNRQSAMDNRQLIKIREASLNNL